MRIMARMVLRWWGWAARKLKDIMVGKARAVSPAVEVAKNMNGDFKPKEVTLPSGDRVILKPITASLVDAVTSRIKDPKPPMWHNPDKDIDEPNPSHPDYLEELREVGRLRGMAAMDAMCMFGVELVNGVPEDGKWIKKLEFMQKHGMLDLTGYDLNDELDREFLYKRYIAVDASVINQISELSGISGEEVTAAEESFPG